MKKTIFLVFLGIILLLTSCKKPMHVAGCEFGDDPRFLFEENSSRVACVFREKTYFGDYSQKGKRLSISIPEMFINDLDGNDYDLSKCKIIKGKIYIYCTKSHKQYLSLSFRGASKNFFTNPLRDTTKIYAGMSFEFSENKVRFKKKEKKYNFYNGKYQFEDNEATDNTDELLKQISYSFFLDKLSNEYNNTPFINHKNASKYVAQVHAAHWPGAVVTNPTDKYLFVQRVFLTYDYEKTYSIENIHLPNFEHISIFLSTSRQELLKTYFSAKLEVTSSITKEIQDKITNSYGYGYLVFELQPDIITTINKKLKNTSEKNELAYRIISTNLYCMQDFEKIPTTNNDNLKFYTNSYF